MDLGKRYKELRQTIRNSLGNTISIKELSEKLQLSSPRISELENNKREMSLTELKAYHNFFHVSFEYLLGETDIPSNNEDIQTACKVTGLSEEAIKNLKSKIDLREDVDIISILNIILTCNEFWSMVFNFSILEKKSEYQAANIENITFENLYDFSTKTGISMAELVEHIAKEFEFSNELIKKDDFENECDLARYSAFRATERMTDLFDHRCDCKHFNKDEIIEYLHLDRLKKKEEDYGKYNTTQE